MKICVFAEIENTVEVVGHDLLRNNRHLWELTADGRPLLGYGQPQFCEYNPWCLG